MVRLIRTRCSGVDCRDTITAAVAAMSEASTKKCHGLNPASPWACAVWFAASASGPTPRLIQGAELILQPLAQGGVVGRRRGHSGFERRLPLRPPHGHEPDDAGT